MTSQQQKDNDRIYDDAQILKANEARWDIPLGVTSLLGLAQLVGMGFLTYTLLNGNEVFFVIDPEKSYSMGSKVFLTNVTDDDGKFISIHWATQLATATQNRNDAQANLDNMIAISNTSVATVARDTATRNTAKATLAEKIAKNIPPTTSGTADVVAAQVNLTNMEAVLNLSLASLATAQTNVTNATTNLTAKQQELAAVLAGIKEERVSNKFRLTEYTISSHTVPLIALSLVAAICQVIFNIIYTIRSGTKLNNSLNMILNIGMGISLWIIYTNFIDIFQYTSDVKVTLPDSYVSGNAVLKVCIAYWFVFVILSFPMNSAIYKNGKFKSTTKIASTTPSSYI